MFLYLTRTIFAKRHGKNLRRIYLEKMGKNQTLPVCREVPVRVPCCSKFKRKKCVAVWFRKDMFVSFLWVVFCQKNLIGLDSAKVFSIRATFCLKEAHRSFNKDTLRLTLRLFNCLTSKLKPLGSGSGTSLAISLHGFEPKMLTLDEFFF